MNTSTMKGGDIVDDESKSTTTMNEGDIVMNEGDIVDDESKSTTRMNEGDIVMNEGDIVDDESKSTTTMNEGDIVMNEGDIVDDESKSTTMNDDGDLIESNDGLLIEILTFLPPKSVFRFMAVSKRWMNIINSPFFLNSYSYKRRHNPLPAVMSALLPKTFLLEGTPMNIQTISSSSSSRMRKYELPKGFGYMISSSNGLIICCRLHHRPHPNSDLVYPTYTVFNPVTGRSVSIPQPPYKDWYSHITLGFMCEDNTSQLKANYILVRLSTGQCLDRLMGTYSSKTGQWVESTVVSTGRILRFLRDPAVVANNVFHWFACTDLFMKNGLLLCSLVVYDPYDGQNHLQLIVLPKLIRDSWCGVVTRSSPNDGDILWYGKCNLDKHIKFWILPRSGGGYKRETTIPAEEWTLMYKISLERPSMGSDAILNMRTRIPFVVFPLGLDAFVSQDPLVVLVRNRYTWSLYNLKTGSWKLVGHYGAKMFLGGNQYLWHQPSFSPFLESPLLSSYARL